MPLNEIVPPELRWITQYKSPVVQVGAAERTLISEAVAVVSSILHIVSVGLRQRARGGLALAYHANKTY